MPRFPKISIFNNIPSWLLGGKQQQRVALGDDDGVLQVCDKDDDGDNHTDDDDNHSDDDDNHIEDDDAF